MNEQPILTTNERGKWWCLNGYFHRENEPAIELNDGYKAWYLNGLRHREDGPAIIYADGRQSWCLNDKQYSSKEEWFQKLTPEQKLNYLWTLNEE
jgi:hypothetical protein